MNLPHGPENKQKRIAMRAEAIARGAWWGDQPDETDINSDEAAEIAASKALAANYTTENDTVTFDIPAIEAALVAAGATADEADALTDILHEEGWGGAEYELTPEVFAAKVAWYREERAN
jgi:hypothetical protein